MDRPLHATKHCRHYKFRMTAPMQGGPVCAIGVDLNPPGAARCCMPEPARDGFSCAQREEYTETERQAWEAYRMHRMEAQAQIMVLIPGSSRDRKKRDQWGKTGSFGCPACDWGVVRWSRAMNNGHLWAACNTPGCFSVIE